MITQLPDSSKTKKVWQTPTLTVMSSTEQIQGGGNQTNIHEAGQANGKFYTAPNASPINKMTASINVFNNYHS